MHKAFQCIYCGCIHGFPCDTLRDCDMKKYMGFFFFRWFWRTDDHQNRYLDEIKMLFSRIYFFFNSSKKLLYLYGSASWLIFTFFSVNELCFVVYKYWKRGLVHACQSLCKIFTTNPLLEDYLCNIYNCGMNSC